MGANLLMLQLIWKQKLNDKQFASIYSQKLVVTHEQKSNHIKNGCSLSCFRLTPSRELVSRIVLHSTEFKEKWLQCG